jgi:type I restriction enzyme, S subunit
MTLETLFEKFDQFADAPDTVAKMRELVLHLAVTGKLVRQNPKEQTADGLMIAVKKSRDSMVGEGTIRRIEAQPPLTDEDIPFECPAGWIWVRFGEISSSYRGHNPPKSVFKDKPAPGYVRFIQQRDFRTDDHAVYVPESRHLKLVRKGEIVMATYGNIGNTCRTVEGAFNVAIAKVMEIPPVERDYIDLLIRSDYIRGALEKVSSRVAVSSMSSDHMRSLPVPLPPLAEQKRIVAKVDELMALCDRLQAQQQVREEQTSKLARASLARLANAPTPENLQFIFHLAFSIQPSDLRKSILSLAVQGKLVPQDPKDEPAPELLAKLEQKSRGRFEMNDDLWTCHTIPSSWAWTALGNYAECSRGRFSVRPRNDPSCYNGPYPFIQIRDVSERGGLIKSHSQTLNEKGLSVSKMFKAGTVVVAIVGATIGNTGILAYDMCFPDSLVGLETGNLNGNRYVEVFLLARIQRIRELSYSGGGQPNIKLSILNPFPFPLPPLAEQDRIVAKVDQLMALVDRLETELAAARATAANLLEAVVAELTGTTSVRKVSPQLGSSTGRRGRPPKSP